MDSHALLTVGILSAIGFSSCQNELPLNGPLNGAVGGSVEFTLNNPPSAPPQGITWRFRETPIFTSIGETELPNVVYDGRTSVNKFTASLELRGLTQNDTGLYTVEINISGVVSQGKTSLTVFEKISNVTAEANQNELVEFNSSVILTCSASGSSPSFRWLNRSAVVTGSENKTLTVLNVTRYDTGPFQCEASNAINAQMSSDVNLTIA
ncbi:carcinoembryonic antigen-related cell adhesion molecule 8-like isoform X2 [Clupea harengus]|uniref:Carcinoembryonic antigen-related cell adhesion molecule 8-like isoform X2 n=1 Tax=Clupea harengus TaxID=7950 RepID=A0A6P8G883_CLUHA|nr:carcinoembryonic antigen-related cell adhesion molecule 8-like isoform X2 [Clupea harengus]